MVHMIIAGIDPGTARMGWAIVKTEKNLVKPVAFGCITTSVRVSDEIRLLSIFEQLSKLLVLYKPDHLALEALFFATNAKTVIPVAESRGAVLLASAIKNIPVHSYSPRAVKNAIAGSGSADKAQVTAMVMRILHLDTPPKPDDTADALAIALTHAYSYKLKEKII